jgi:Mn2+/Fe2+ NRAMP family transporter
LLLTNDRELMGDHVNGRGFNVVAWTTVIVVVGMAFLMIFFH